MESVKRIDVTWVKDEWPSHFFEVENTTGITSGLQRMFRALQFDAKFFIVAPEEASRRFSREIEKAPFKNNKRKYRFRSHSQLERIYRVVKRY